MTTTELIASALTFLTVAGGGLSAAIVKLWAWIDKRIVDCEADRLVLHAKVETMHGEMKLISRTVGHMEGELKAISERNNEIDHQKPR